MPISNTDVYTNADGLKFRFGTAQAKIAKAGAVVNAGGNQQVEYILDYSTFPAFGTSTLVDELVTVALPAGALITKATIFVTTAFTSGGSATLTIGTYQADGSTVIDEDGIDATIALSALNAVGKQVACDGALVGGVALTADSYLSVLVGTANFTAGKAKLVIEYMLPTA